MCEIVYNILITNFTVHRCIIRSNAPSNLQMQPLGCIFVYALNCITFGTAIEPCMGSGHILVYAFDILMEIYREVGYSDRDAALSIVENNLFGMDIDKRAYQLAYFAVMMKARSYNRRALTKGISNNLAVVEESNSIDQFICDGVTTNDEQNKIGEYLVEAYKDAQEIGTLQTIEKKDYIGFTDYLHGIASSAELTEIGSNDWVNDIHPKMLQFAKQAEIMSKKYAVVCTNPPYMNKLEGQLKKFVVDNYKSYSGDLFSVFMYRNFDYCKSDGYSAFMTPNVWMFIKTYENLRNYIINQKTIISLIQMAKGAFFKEATVDISTFILKNCKSKESGLYIRLEKFKGDMEVQKQKVLEAIDNKNCGYFYETEQSNFFKIPGCPIAYWVSEQMQKVFATSKKMKDIAIPKVGLQTGNNNKFTRLWFEVEINKCSFCVNQNSEEYYRRKWFPYNKGGEYRKWYGNYEYVVNWENDGFEIKNYTDEKGKLKSRPQNIEYYFRPSISWSFISSSYFGVRYSPKKAIFDVAGSSVFPDEKNMMYLTGLLCSKLSTEFMVVQNPTLNFQVGNVANIPVIVSEKDKIEPLVEKNIDIAKYDWDAFETSWDFKKHPLLSYTSNIISSAWDSWTKECNDQFEVSKNNEEELNRIFIDIYGLQDELTPEVEDKDVTVRKADLQRDIKSLISYAVGCMLGRYSLDEDGLAYAGGEWDNSKYDTFIPDADNCIPITDEEYFEDDIVGLFCAWLKKVYGEDTLEENLDFIANAIGNKGKTSREVMRNYFLTDFIKDHIKTYQKRPIYWLFDSGKQNGFKALVYMHRWNADTIGNVRVEYLHRIQRVYEKEIIRMQEIIDNSHDNKEISNATKRKEKLQKQIKETKDYDAKIAHLALSRIDIDLDDGVKVNYEKVQTADGKKMQILAKI